MAEKRKNYIAVDRLQASFILKSRLAVMGGELHQTEGQRGKCSQSWIEKTIMIDCISSLLYRL
jgi:hypothetical protein